MSGITRATALMLLTATAAAAATETLSPGSTTESVTLETACPTFSWAQLPDASGYELVVYRLGEDGSPAPRPEVEKNLPAGAGTWTLDRCLEPGGRYAWSVRAVEGETNAGWSEARLFRVAERRWALAAQEAVSVLQEYLRNCPQQPSPLAEARPQRPAAAPARSVPADGQRAAEPPTRATAADSSLRVAGDVVLGSGFQDLRTFLLVDGGFGLEVLMVDDVGLNNLGLGRRFHVPTSEGNTWLGEFAMSQSLNNVGDENTVMGYASMFNGGGDGNTAIGNRSLSNLSGDGSHNIAVGAHAGQQLGRFAPQDSTSSFSWNIYIGNEGDDEDEHTIRIGRQRVDTVGHERTFIAGDVAIGTQTGPTNRLVVRDTINGLGDDPDSYVTRMENTNSGNSPDVLALKVGASDPGSGINFIGFFDGDGDLLGEVEGNGLDGVRYTGAELFLVPTNSPPACTSPRKGMLYYDASVNRPCYCDGSNWRSVVDDGLCA